MTDYPIGTVAVATVKNVENIKVLRGEYKTEVVWLYSPLPEFGIKGNVARDNEVRDIVVIDQEVLKPKRAPYQVDEMSARQLEDALIEVLGAGEQEGYEYYDESTGVNAFYHTLAETGGHGYSNSNINLPDSVTVSRVGGKNAIDVPGLGLFTSVDQKTEFMAESGDADSIVVFEFNGRHFKKQGYLDSYEGGVWDGRLEEVKPVEKTIIVWESV